MVLERDSLPRESESEERCRRDRNSTAILLLATCSGVGVAIVAVLRALGWPPIGVDDAYIFLVYGRNLADGLGFVFNPGGERVEGFTSLLWVLVCAVGQKLTEDPRWILLLGSAAILIASTFAAARSVASLVRDRATRWWWTGAFLFLLLTHPGYVTWTSVTLMDTGLWGALLLAVTLLVTGEEPFDRSRTWWFSGALVLLVVTRPESLAWGPFFISLLFARLAIAKGRAAAASGILPPAISFVAAAGSLLLFRIAYFGHPFPNTYYAKVSPSVLHNLAEGLRYLAGYATSGPVVFASVAITVLSVILRPGSGNRGVPEWTIPVTAIFGLGIPVLTGGDHFGAHRFFQPVFPLLLLSTFRWLIRSAPAVVEVRWGDALPLTRRRAATVFLVFLGTLSVGMPWWGFGERTRLPNDFLIGKAGRGAGEDLGRLFSPPASRPSVGLVMVGGFGYGYPGPIVDLLGLNDTRMAHSPGARAGIKNHAAFHRETFFSISPELVNPSIVRDGVWPVIEGGGWARANAEARASFTNFVMNGIFADPEFHRRYLLCGVRRKGGSSNVAMIGWFRRDFAERLTRSPLFDVVVPP